MLRRINEKSIVLAGRFASQAIRILSSIVVARLVAEGEYGRFDMIYAVAGVFSAFIDFGISRTVCNTPDLDDDEVRDTSLVLLIALSTIYSALAIAGGLYFDRFFDDSRLRWVGLIVALAYVCQYLQTAQMSQLARHLHFGSWVVIEFAATAASITVGLVVAIYGGGIFALAFQQFTGQAVVWLLTLFVMPMRWPRRFSMAVAKRFFAFGWRVTIFQAHYGLQICLIRLMIFPRYGDVGVGVYGRAWQIRDLVGQNLASTFEVILTPLIARAKENVDRLRDLYLRGNIAVLAFCSLGAAGMAAVVPDLVRVFLGQKWQTVPELLLPMAVGLVSLGLAMPSVILGIALAATPALIRFAAGSMLMLGIAAIIYRLSDLPTFIYANSLLMIFPALDLIRWGTREAQLSTRQLIRRQIPIVVIAAIAYAVVTFTRESLLTIGGDSENLLYALARLMVCGIVGLLTTWALFAVFDRTNHKALLNLIIRAQATPADSQDAAIALGPMENPTAPGNN